MVDYNANYLKALNRAKAGQTSGPEVYARINGDPGMQMMNVSNLTPEQIEQAEIIKQYGVPYKLQTPTQTQLDSQKAQKGLNKFFSTFMGRDWMNRYYGPTGGAVPINTQMPEMDYQDPRVQYEGMQYQVPGPVTDGLNLPRELAYNPTIDNARLLLNMENERMQANRLRNDIGRDVNKLQVPGLPEWYRNIVRNDARAMEQRIRDLGEQQ